MKTIRTLAVILALVTAVLPFAEVPTTRADSFPTVPYRLVDSTYQEGCFDPCECPILNEQPMIGTFDLVFYPFAGPLWTVAVERLVWSVPALGKEIVGQGIYRRAGDLQELRLDLQIDGAAAEAFDSGWVAGGGSYPFIDVTVSMHGLFCYDIALHVRAKPLIDTPYLAVDGAQLSWSAMPGVSAYDVLCGNLMELRASGGDFSAAVDACLADDHPDTTLAQTVVVEAGQAVWFLVRPQGGSYDSSGDAQLSSRDEEIASSIFACP